MRVKDSRQGIMIMSEDNTIIQREDRILITGSNGFIGSRVVETLLRAGFSNIRCFVRPSSDLTRLSAILRAAPKAQVEILSGNLMSRDDCVKAVKDATVIFHLAASSDKTFPGSFMNCVVTTRNLLDASLQSGCLRRFVNVSSFAVYSNWHIARGGLLDEACELESHVVERSEAYVFAKLKQDQLVMEYGQTYCLPYVIVRPGAVYGPGTRHITGRVGLDTFGVFLHLGGSNQLPLTYVDNCAQAMVLAGIKAGVNGEIFNVVDDDLPSSRHFLRMYKKHGKRFTSIFVPYWFFYGFCWAWEKYSKWSQGQLPPSFNRRRCAAYWKGNRYSNQKLKDRLGWESKVSFSEGAGQYFQYVREMS
jgi:nucleoside-diphosphate-sugar epimerase